MTAKKKNTVTTKKTVKKAPVASAKNDEAMKENHVGKKITVKIGETEYVGLCTTERETNSGGQVYLRLNGLVSRFFNTSDITKVDGVQ